MSNDSIETQLKIIATLKRETRNSHSTLTIKTNGAFVYYFTSTMKTLESNTISKLLEKVIEYMIYERVYIIGANNKKFPCGIKKNVITKYKLIRTNGTKRFKTT